MSPGPERRRYVPAEAYRFMVLAALAHRRGVPATKGELAWETRANHYMLTRVLRELRDAGHVRLDRGEDGAYRIHLTSGGGAFLDQHRAYARSTFAPLLEQHFQFGAAPPWARGLGV